MYLAEVASPELAYAINRRLKERLKILAKWPYLGVALADKPGFRKYPLAPYLVFYRPINLGIEISRVVHGKRDLTRILEDL